MWRDIRSLPEHCADHWAVWQGRPKVCAGLDDLNHQTRLWNPLDPLLVAGPGDARFMPPIFQATLRPSILKRLRRHFLMAAVAWFGLGLCIAIFSMVSSKEISTGFAAVFVLISATLTADHLTAMRHPFGIGQRALFLRWLQTHPKPRTGFFFWSGLMLLCGGVQIALQYHLGSIDALVERYGLVYELVQKGEIWRWLVGPWIHASLSHFMNNAFLIIFIGPLTWGLLGARKSLLGFLMGFLAGPLAQWRWGADDFSSYLGVSAGILALFGVLMAQAHRDKRLVPKGIAITLWGMCIITILGAHLISAKAATAAHLAGLVAGLVWGYWMPRPNSKQVPLLLHDGAQSTA